MANLNVINAAGDSKYIKSTGAGSDVSPYVPEHLETNSDAIKTAVEAVAAAVGGTEVQVDVITSALPSGAATAARQDTGNTSLSSIDTKTPALGQALAAASVPVILPAATITTLTPPAAITGFATAANQSTSNTALAAIQTAVETIDNAIAGTEMQVDVLTMPTVAVTGTFWQATQPVSLATLPTLASGTNNIGDVDILTIAAGETHIGQIGTDDDVIDLTCSLDTSAYASGDLLFDTQALTSAARVNAGKVVLQSLTVLDEDDQGVAFDIYFLDANTSLGTENAAPSITDTNARGILGYVSVNTTDYKDLGGCKVATLRGLGLVMKAGAATTTIYAAGVNGTGTPTFTASGLRLKFGFLRS